MELLDLFKDKKLFIITHNDLDGIASLIIAKYYLQPIATDFQFEVTDRDFNFEDKKLKEADYILYVDISPNESLYNMYADKTFIMDHHVSGRTELGERENYYYDMDRCGARILFEELTKGKRVKRIVQQFCELVDVYDRWQMNSLLWKQAKSLSNILWEGVNWFDKSITDNTRYNDFINTQLDKFSYGNNRNFYFTDLEIKKAENGEKKERNALQQARNSLQFRTDNEKNPYMYFECTSKLSYVSNVLLNEFRDKIKYCISYSTFDKEKCGVSVRSNNDFDCSLLAELHGGGGHKSASGIKFENRKFFEDLRKGNVHLL